jgi:hypothetical protein
LEPSVGVLEQVSAESYEIRNGTGDDLEAAKPADLLERRSAQVEGKSNHDESETKRRCNDSN